MGVYLCLQHYYCSKTYQVKHIHDYEDNCRSGTEWQRQQWRPCLTGVFALMNMLMNKKIENTPVEE